MDYRYVKMWLDKGFVQSSDTPELTNYLVHAKNLLNCRLVLNNYDIEYYRDIECVLYPVVVYYVKHKKTVFINGESIIHKFLDFCEKTINIKYYLKELDDDLKLCEEFIAFY